MARGAIALVLLLAACEPAGPQPPAPARTTSAAISGEALFAAHCASCHLDTAGSRAPSLRALRSMNIAAIAFSMTNGRMKAESAALSPAQKRALAGHLGVPEEPYRPSQEALCSRASIDPSPAVARWGFDSRNSGRIGEGVSELDAARVGSLGLAWVFGLPHSSNARSQPVITADTLFLAAEGSGLFALDRWRGCTKWHRSTLAAPRTALTLGRSGGRDALFFGDVEAHVNAVDAITGELLFRADTRVGEHSLLTGAIVQHGERLIVPVSLYEVALARDPAYECCRTHGAVVALDANTGETLWTTPLTDEATPRGKTAAGVRRWGPSGVGVWSTPTIDAKRGLLYVGTAQNASAPATDYSDSVLALDLDHGRVVWHFQALAGDTYNDACSEFPRGPNCPKRAGPDFDIGASIVLTRSSTGRETLLVGQKSGDVYALDPEQQGRLIWHRRVGSGSVLGGVHWGLATHDGVVFAPVSDPEFPVPGYFPKPGLYALRVDDGRTLWEHPIERGCEAGFREYLGREMLYPECSFYYGLSAAPTVVNDLVFSPALDGRIRAFAAGDGALLWEFETARPFEAINGVETHGGSIDVAGVSAVGRMVYVQSGYGTFGQLPGNALLAFELPPEAEDHASPGRAAEGWAQGLGKVQPSAMPSFSILE